MLTGRTPFDDTGNPAATITMIIQGRTPRLENEPSLRAYPQLRALLEKCWNMALENRPTIKDALRMIVEGNDFGSDDSESGDTHSFVENRLGQLTT